MQGVFFLESKKVLFVLKLLLLDKLAQLEKALFGQKIVNKTLHCYKMSKIDDKVLHLFN